MPDLSQPEPQITIDASVVVVRNPGWRTDRTEDGYLVVRPLVRPDDGLPADLRRRGGAVAGRSHPRGAARRGLTPVGADFHVRQVLGSGLSRTVYKGPDPSRAAAAEAALIDRSKRVRTTRDGMTVTSGSRGRR
jgi:hypothetical protein